MSTLQRELNVKHYSGLAADIPASLKPGDYFRATDTGAIYIADQTGALKEQTNYTTVPATADAPGVEGQVAIESGFLYTCVATDTWERVATATWT